GPVFDEVWDYVIKGEKYWVNKLVKENNSHKRASQLQVTLSQQVNINLRIRYFYIVVEIYQESATSSF
ncbi:44586_t:CDS:2, partial [Gigaspora margarita]